MAVAAVRWCGANGAIVARHKTNGAMGFRRARTAFDWFVFHRYYGVNYRNTLKRLFLVQFLLVRIKKTER